MKKTLIVLLALVLGLGAQARTIRDFFTSESGDLFLILSKTARLDMLDYYDYGQKVQTMNYFGTDTKLDSVNNNYLQIQMSKSKKVQMLLTVSNRDTVIAVIETFELPTHDSNITFYDAQWRRLDASKYFKMPGIDSFLSKDVNKQERATLLQDISFPLIELTFEGDGYKTLVARHRLKEFMTKEEFQKIEKKFVPSLTFKLSGTKWKPTK